MNIPPRNEIPAKYKWNAESVFASVEAWEAEVKSITASLDEVKGHQSRMAASPAALADALAAVDELGRRVTVVAVYAGISHHTDTADQNAAGLWGKATGLVGQAMAAASFVNPALLAIGQETLRKWLDQEPRLKIYEHYVANLFRKQAHVRSAEVEEVLGLLADPFEGATTTADLLTSADFKFEAATAEDGAKLEVTQGSFDEILSGADREARRTAFDSYTGKYLEFKNTLAGNLGTSIKQNIFAMRARKHTSSLTASLFENNIPVEVFHNLINTFQKNLPTWHRYWQIRRKALGVEELHPYDIWAPLTRNPPRIPLDQAVEWICDGLAPLGEEYVLAVRQGCLEQRWVDVYPNKGKRSGAYSWGTQGTHPFIVMSYVDDIESLSTLAHELGHSMHSYLTWKNQPFVYGEYSLFAAEVASNFHQAMVRAHLLKAHADRDFQISVITEAMSNFHRYFFIMPTLARFELETHERVEKGGALTADDMSALMADLFAEGYGGHMRVDRERVGITWATFGHLYSDYYVYQYATGISGAHALSKRILDKENNAVDDYLKFLKAGASAYPLEALKLAGVDLTTPKAVEDTFAVLGAYVDRLEKLVGSA